jgi:hypothetical protein
VAEAATAGEPHRRRAWRAGRVLLWVALVLALVVSTRAIADEGEVSLQGDMSRYLMNGVLLHDLVLSGRWTPSAALDYAILYYAKYPALSIGHHPPLLPMLLAPFFGVFGISVAAARVAIVLSFLAAVLLQFSLARRLYGEVPAGWASVLFASTPGVAVYGQQVLSEIPVLAVSLAALVYLVRFCERRRPRDYFLFVGAVALSLFGRQTSAYMVPGYLVILVAMGGLPGLKQRSVAVATLFGVLAILAAGVATLLLSPFNTTVVGYVMRYSIDNLLSFRILSRMFADYPVPFLLVAAGTAGILAMLGRDRRAFVPAAWVLSVALCTIVITGPVAPARYSLAMLPGLALLAASLVVYVPALPWRAAALGLLGLAAGTQSWTTLSLMPDGARGYEAAAELVVKTAPGPTVLYSASVDTGYFVFFVRKHDPAGRLIVLRSDKVLTTSLMSEVSIEDRISSPEQIYDVLNEFGVSHVIIEERPTGSRVLDWLHAAVRVDPFTEIARIPLESRDPRLRSVDLVVYEYRDKRAPAPDARLDLNLPLAGRRISPLLSELAPGVGPP